MATARTGVRNLLLYVLEVARAAMSNVIVSADPHCVNCRGDHAASSKTCPKFLEEQAILRYNAENGSTFQQARKAVVVEIHKTIATRTFASAISPSLERSQQRSPRMAAEVPLLPCPRGKKPRRILRLPVPREQQKPKYQPSSGPKSQKDRRPSGNKQSFCASGDGC
ncbi:hypothetical protein PoB_004020000 [Plakobranchus ocellatus]|uniref:Uncharacterized protein n=1 Tax=Plakobranchus ocellatus TaxID=259542 RepID=A0AAV4B3N0_9GAST|nr:hypothetical protein PoB_004020000 [Plakobranchus ocellatus]